MFKPAELKHLAIVRLSAIGDVVLLLPVIHSLKKALPSLKITWITSKDAYEILEGINGVEFILLEKKQYWKELFSLKKTLSSQHFDALLAVQASWRANLIYPLIHAPLKIGFDKTRARDFQWLFTNNRIPFVRNQHLMDSFFSFIQELGITERELIWDLPISKKDREWATSQLGHLQGPFIVVNPAASKPERTWVPSRYVDVIKHAQKEWKAHVILTGGNNSYEKSLGTMIASALRGNFTNLIGKTTLKQLAALLDKADCLIAPDTGPVHIAVAVGTPVIGLYAVAPPEVTGPYLFQHFVVNKFPEAVKTILKKNPERIKWGRRVHSSKAMELITSKDVIEKLSLLFQKG